MTQEKLQLAIDDMLHILKADKHCVDSYRAVSNVKSLRDYAIVLNRFRTELRHQNFPTEEYMKKWFVEDLEEINKYGVYIDQKGVRHEQNSFDVFAFGESEIMVVMNNVKHQHVVANNNSKINVVTCPHSVCFVQLKNNSEVSVTNTHKTAIVKIIDKRDNGKGKDNTND